MSSHCVLEQCYCGPEDVPEEKAEEEEEANIARDVSICFPMFPSHLLSFIQQHTGMYIYIYIYIYAFMVLARPGAVTVGSRGNDGGSPV